ncbi:MAG: hypothetical protein A2Z37_00770 [Chloroflexi bacterium RBG_19FT_COMBO_62_14]|nr:MAG: hypothetical protein A2Z37_00770 [Chloroflexi bacterium RBG_19FT_COMBO_62_14]
MTSTTVSVARPSLSWRVLIPGLVASLVLGMWQMIAEALIPTGAGLWSPPIYIAATILRDLQGAGSPAAFNLLGVVLGLMGHMMNSVILGLIFAFLIGPRLSSLGSQVLGGVVYGTAIFLMMWFLILPIFDPVMLNLNAAVFFLGHMMWGAALGGLSNLAARA